MPRPTVTKLFRNPWALSIALATIGMLHSRALGFLNSLFTLVLASNYYLAIIFLKVQTSMRSSYNTHIYKNAITTKRQSNKCLKIIAGVIGY